MGAIFKFILGLLVPPDQYPWDMVPGVHDQEKVEEVKRAMRRWHIGISTVAGALFVLAVGSFVTPYGFAVAGDSPKQVEEAVKPLAETVAKLDQRSKENEEANRQTLEALNELRAAALADTLDRMVRRRCVETDVDELTALRRSIEDNKVVFQTLAHREYVEPTCAELRR